MKVIIYFILLLVPCFSIAQSVEIKEKKGYKYLTLKKKAIAGPFNAVEKVYATSQYLVKTDKWGITDDLGSKVTANIYDSISHANSKYYIIQTDGRYGIIDTSGTSIVEPKFQNIDHFTNEQKGVVKYEDQWFFLKNSELISGGDSLIFRSPNQKPKFSDCDIDTVEKGRMKCDTKEMLEFIFDNIKYPAEAIASGIEGMVVVKFIVEKDGTLTNLEVVRDIGGGCGEEALQVVRKMNPWVPGNQDGKAVRTAFFLPIKFKS